MEDTLISSKRGKFNVGAQICIERKIKADAEAEAVPRQKL